MPLMPVMSAAGTPEAAAIARPVAIGAHAAVSHPAPVERRRDNAGENGESGDCDGEDDRAVHRTPIHALQGAPR
jgi:hypothetical protein